MADLAFCFHLKQQPAAVMASRRNCMFEDETEQSLLQELTASDQRNCSDDDDSSGMDDFTVGEVIGSECSDNESDDVQFATASSMPSALSATFMWEDMTNYVGQREQFVDNCVSVLDYNKNMGGVVDLKDQFIQPCLLERKKMTKWYIKLFREILNIAVLNCMVICRINSGQTKIDHFKFRVELVHALLNKHASESVRKFEGHHSTDKNVPQLVKRHFPERIPPTEKKSQANEEVCSVLQKQ